MCNYFCLTVRIFPELSIKPLFSPHKTLFSQIFLFFVERSDKHLKFFRRLAGFFAHFLLLVRSLENALNPIAFKIFTFAAHFHAVFFCTRKKHKAALRTAAAARTPDFIIADNVVAPADFIPEYCGFVQLFVGFGEKSRTNRAVVAADRYNRLNITKPLRSFNIPLQFITPRSMIV